MNSVSAKYDELSRSFQSDIVRSDFRNANNNASRKICDQAMRGKKHKLVVDVGSGKGGGWPKLFNHLDWSACVIMADISPKSLDKSL